MRKNITQKIFLALTIVFVWVVCQVTIPAISLFKGSSLFLLPFVIFFLLGAALLFFTIKEKFGGPIKKFLLLTGASAAGVFVFIFLHNFVYGLFIYFFGQDFWERIGLGDEPLFFFLALVVCPTAFLVGMIGTIVLLIREKKKIR